MPKGCCGRESRLVGFFLLLSVLLLLLLLRSSPEGGGLKKSRSRGTSALAPSGRLMLLA